MLCYNIPLISTYLVVVIVVTVVTTRGILWYFYLHVSVQEVYQ